MYTKCRSQKILFSIICSVLFCILFSIPKSNGQALEYTYQARSKFLQEEIYHNKIFKETISQEVIESINDTDPLGLQHDFNPFTIVDGFSEGVSPFIGLPDSTLEFEEGFVNKDGKISISVEGSVRSFSEGYAQLVQEGKSGFIDKAADIVIPVIFDYPIEKGQRPWIEPHSRWDRITDGFSDGFAAVMLDSKWGLINKQGEIVVQPEFDLLGAPSEGLAPFQLDNVWGFVNTSGQVVIQPKFQSIGRKMSDEYIFSEGRALIVFNDKFGYIDPSGSIAIEPIFEDAGAFSEGLAFVEADNHKYGYIDASGDIVVDPVFDYASSFSEGVAAVKVGSEAGYIDSSGQFIIEPRFNNALSFSEGLAPIQMNDLWGYIDIMGNIAVAPQFSIANGFLEGVARVCQQLDEQVCFPLYKRSLLSRMP